MARDDPKFASEQDGKWLPHDFGKVYAHEHTSTQRRLRVAASFDGTALPRELTLALAAPFLLLYVQAASEQGVEQRDVALLRRVPRDYSLPMGCTDPQALAAIDYAAAYNRAIIKHLRHARRRQRSLSSVSLVLQVMARQSACRNGFTEVT